MGGILFTADWHIKHTDRIWAHRPQITGDLQCAMQQVIQYLEQKEPEAVILCGDIFDKPTVTAFGLHIFLDFLRVCQKVGAKVYFVQGQHEWSEPPLLRSISAQCEHLHNRRIYANSTYLYGLDIMRDPPEKPLDIAADILVTHQVWKEFIPVAGVLSLDLIVGPSVVVSGDYHVPCERTYDSGVTLISPGPLVPQALDQIHDKSLVYLEGESFVRLPIKARKIFRIALKVPQHVENFIKEFKQGSYLTPDYPEPIRQPVIVVDYEPDLKAMAEIRALVGDQAFLIVNPSPGEDMVTTASPLTELPSVESLITELAGDNKLIADLSLSYWRAGLGPIRAYFETDELKGFLDESKTRTPK
jgi:predicted phosphodiesterase